MQLQFKIVEASPVLGPSQEYFSAIVSAASRALAGAVRDTNGAWALCEYLDAVDGGDVVMDRGLYRSCVSVLGDFLGQHCDNATVRKLADKSWAAKTLLEMLDNYVPKQLKRAA